MGAAYGITERVFRLVALLVAVLRLDLQEMLEGISELDEADESLVRLVQECLDVQREVVGSLVHVATVPDRCFRPLSHHLEILAAAWPALSSGRGPWPCRG